MFAALVAALGFSSCNETWDDNPTLPTHEGDPVEEFLNIPVEANTAVMITEAMNKGTLHLTGSQPTQYGYAATVAYDVEMALNEDFTTPAVEGADVPASVTVGRFFDLSEINPTLRSVAEGMCKLLNIQEAASIPTPYHKVYIRLRANVVNENDQIVPNTAITSNTICYNQIAVGYLAIVIPDLPTIYYIRGGMNDWLNPQFNENINLEVLPNWNFLTTTEADVYELPYVEIPANTEFKFADKNWGDLNVSTTSAIIMNEWINGEWDIQSNIKLSSPFKGAVMLKGSGQNWQIKFVPAEPDTPGQASGIYATGAFADWKFENSAYEFKTTDVKNTWKIDNITIAAGEFKVADPSWSEVNLGSNGTPIMLGVNYTCEFGGGNMILDTAFEGSITLRKKNGKWILLLQPKA